MIGILASGGLCPGSNCVVHELVSQLADKKPIGILCGYKGIYEKKTKILHPKETLEYRNKGGCIIGVSRTKFETDKICTNLHDMNISQLYVIGGNGTQSGAHEIASSTDIQVIGIPKTIDNDIPYVDVSFGFYSAIDSVLRQIDSAYIEATASNAISIIEIMGSDSGSLGYYSTIAYGKVDIVLYPEFPFDKHKLLNEIKKLYTSKNHCVIVVCEGVKRNIGEYLYRHIKRHITTIPITLVHSSSLCRTIDPCAFDLHYCTILAHKAVEEMNKGNTDICVTQAQNVELKHIYKKIKTLNEIR